MMKRGRQLAVLTLAVALLGGAAWADQNGLEQRIEQRLKKLDGDVKVDVRHDSVVLTGVVTTVHDSRAAERAARKEAKGRTVENRIRVVSDAPNDRLDKAVEKAILHSVYYTVFDSVGYALEPSGVVVLTGSVQQGFHRNDIEDQVTRVKGVRQVENRIKVQPTSLFDDRLRRELYAKIYGNVLGPWASHVNPPVRIVVERGRVTLTGSVLSRVEQVKLGMVARETLAFGVDNQVEIEGSRREARVRTNS